MLKKVFILTLAFCFTGMVSAAVLSDSVLQSFTDLAWNGNTAATSDIPGDPGTAITVTLTGDGWTDVALGIDDSGGLTGGDVWELTVHNPDAYSTFVQPFLQVDGWTWTVYTDGWVSAGETVTFISELDPSITTVERIGIKIGTDAWTGRDATSGATFDLHITPEPASLLLLGLGAVALRKRKSYK